MACIHLYIYTRYRSIYSSCMKYITHLSITLLFLFFSCTQPVTLHNQVIIRQVNDPEMLNPVNYTDARAGNIMNHLFQKLIDIDYKNPTNIIPVLATSRPLIEKIEGGKMLLTFSIRKEAKWDNGASITAKDVDFTIKTFKCPLVNNPNSKSFFDFITDFEYDKTDPNKFIIKTDTLYFTAEATFTDMPILPEHIYDPTSILRKYSVKQITKEFINLKSNSEIIAFAGNFNSARYMYDPSSIEGSGAYKLTEWRKNDYIILTKKENWWGDFFQKESCFFEAYPSKLIFKTITDQTAAITALKAGNINVMSSIKPKDYSEMIKSEKLTNNYNLFNFPEYSYLYIGLNTLSPILKDKNVRKAIAYITNIDDIIKTITYDQATKTAVPIHPSKTTFNNDIVHYGYDLTKAKKILSDAGWKDSNKNEILDKQINGRTEELELNLMVNAGNEERKSIAFLFQAEAKKVGIGINIQTFDWSVFLERCSSHNFDMMIGKWISGPGPDDLKQCFHSASANGTGTNYMCYSNTQLDSIIHSIRYEIDEEKRKKLYDKAQEIIHEDVPMIFLYIPTNKIAISKQFENAYPSLIQPGYWAQGFKNITQ